MWKLNGLRWPRWGSKLGADSHFELVAEMDLEGIVAKRLADPYAPGRTTWFKILNRGYSQKVGRSELFERGQQARISPT
jgi:hypothetical protein